jgi:predicted metal-dependent phosphoesterase TrpH
MLSVLTVLTTGAVAVDAPESAEDGKGQLSIEAVDRDTGAALAVRVRITPRALLQDDRVWVNRRGRFEARLASGSYKVSVTHGPEWSVVERDVVITGGATARLRAELSHEVDARAFTGCDLHVHTAESPDSNLDLAARIDTLLAEDVHFAVLTDHNRVTDAVAALAEQGIAALPGVEVTTWNPELGHFNVFPTRRAPRYQHTDAQGLLHELRKDADSFVQVNHPRLEGHIGYFDLARFDRATGKGASAFPLSFDGIEVWNGYDLAAPGRRDEVFRDWLAMVARGQHITATGNSDSHKAGLAPFVGYPRTYVHVPRDKAHLPGKVLSALKHGRAFVTNGPILDLHVRGKGPGDTVSLVHGEHSLPVRVDVQAPVWMQLVEVELWLGEELVTTLSLAGRAEASKHSVSTNLAVDDQRSLVVTVRGAASMKPLIGRSLVTPYAFSNPVWLTRH